MSAANFFQEPSQLEPYVLHDVGDLRHKVAELMERDRQLSASVPNDGGSDVSSLVLRMSCHYSSLIEGIRIGDDDIQAAQLGGFAEDPERRRLQSLSQAHIQAEMDAACWVASGEVPYSSEFIRKVHHSFCSRLPDEALRLSDGSLMVPGEFRSVQVRVGEHVAPAAASVASFMDRFESTQAGIRTQELRVINAFAGHHRLSWIHPFADFNGRVARIALGAQLRALGIGERGYWTWTHGAGSNIEGYLCALAGADRGRAGDLDGRGNLSTRALREFVGYGLDVAISEVRFMVPSAPIAIRLARQSAGERATPNAQ